MLNLLLILENLISMFRTPCYCKIEVRNSNYLR